MTDSPNSLPDEAVKVIMNRVMQWRLVLIMYSDAKYQMHVDSSLSFMVG